MSSAVGTVGAVGSPVAAPSAVTVGTGLVRVTVVAPDCRVDVALPEDVPLADLYPEILRLTGRTQASGAPTGFHLARVDGSVLDSARALSAQAVHDGALLRFTALADAAPAPVYDDVADAVASSVTADHRLWSPELLRRAGLAGAAVFLSLAPVALWRTAEPHSVAGLLAAALALVSAAVAGARARVYDDADAAAVLGLAALPNAFYAGLGAIRPEAGEGPGRVQFVAACAAVMVAAALIAVLVPTRKATYVAGVGAGAAGMLTAFGLIAADASPRDAAAVSGIAGLAAVGFLPSWSVRLARLPIGFLPPDAPPAARAAADDPVDHEALAARARAGHQTLTGLVGACAVVVAASALLLGHSSSVWSQVLTASLGIALLTRARLFRHTAQVVLLLAAGALSLAFLFAGLIPQATDTERQAWLFGLIAAMGAVPGLIAVTVPARGLSPFWGRAMDILEGMLLTAVIPLCLAVLGVYGTLRNITG
ncbi:type VII secretion integral membrane protein EccD [Yinghuangia sp. ASG 101]|uniref:type VII secretion integral membrane protein EccD n=1 Tax=Yinghuangia sp. ASG 101 TaxID=2896848 RepID=UPI001E31A969|nr:type VII secretion integral membrane protein EccD [Yinghuangia sp. ASG 101]UGQ09910.1 type VII secretion integral membrane protein EccD [Yinghuangia sp. ASG 101]